MKPLRKSNWIFNDETDKINLLAREAARQDRARTPRDPAWVFRFLKAAR